MYSLPACKNIDKDKEIGKYKSSTYKNASLQKNEKATERQTERKYKCLTDKNASLQKMKKRQKDRQRKVSKK